MIDLGPVGPVCIECGKEPYKRKGRVYDLCANCLLDQVLVAFETGEEIGRKLVEIKIGSLVFEKDKYFVWAYDDYEWGPGFYDCKGIFNEFGGADERANEFVDSNHNVDIYRVNDDNILTLIKWWDAGEEKFAKDSEYMPRRGQGLPLGEKRVNIKYE